MLFISFDTTQSNHNELWLSNGLVAWPGNLKLSKIDCLKQVGGLAQAHHTEHPQVNFSQMGRLIMTRQAQS